MKLEYNETKKQLEECLKEIKRIKSEQIPKGIEFNNLCDDYEKLKEELNKLKDNNFQIKIDMLNMNEKDEIIIGDNNPINIDNYIYEENKPKKVNFDEDSKERAMMRIKRMQEKQKEEKEKRRVRKSVKVSNIVKSLEEARKKQREEEK